MQTEPLSHAAMVAQLDAPTQAALSLHVLDTVDSTNVWCRDQRRAGAIPPFACIAERQTQGRGRRGRQWRSPAGANIYLSLAWRFDMPMQQLGLLSLWLGLAVRDCLRTIGIDRAQLKWPNDVLVDNHKIAGVLIESAQAGAATDMIIGVGVNHAMPAQSMPVDISWTDVRRHLPADGKVSRNQLAGLLLRDLARACRQYQSRPEDCLRRLRQCFSQSQQVVIYTEQGENLTGATKGITDQGELRVDIHGEERVFSSADVSLRPRHDDIREKAVAGDG